MSPIIGCVAGAFEIDRIVVVPMFPQYASATTGGVVERCSKHAAGMWNTPFLSFLPPYFDDEGYLDAWQEVAADRLAAFQPDHVLLSYHGLPERQIFKGDPSGSHCLKVKDCCAVENSANKNCYRRQCMATSRAIIQRLGLQEGKYSLTFQSRLGRDPWLSPATDQTVVALFSTFEGTVMTARRPLPRKCSPRRVRARHSPVAAMGSDTLFALTSTTLPSGATVSSYRAVPSARRVARTARSGV